MGVNVSEVVNEEGLTGALEDHMIPEEQLAYAKLINYGSSIGIGLLILGFVLYITGILAPAIPVAAIPSVWHLSVHEYVQLLEVPTGWAWLAYLGRGDYFNFIGIAFLALLTIVGYVKLLPAYIRRKDGAYAFMVTAEIFVLVLAASGILQVGGH